jgi:uncharacterized Zn finger protein
VSRDRWPAYVSAAERRSNAASESKKLTKTGKELRPIHIRSSAIATSFWGIAWCKNLENYADWANRLPRGRSYARSGSILDLQITPGLIEAMVSGSRLYKIKIAIHRLEAKKWKSIKKNCAQQVSSLLDLMRGKLPEDVLARLTDAKEGMFPTPRELELRCSCPDYATMCKHVAATLYGVGHLLDTEPELFFRMRGVDQSELVSEEMTGNTVADAIGLNQKSDLASEDLAEIFGIELAMTKEDSKELARSEPKRPGGKAALKKVKSKTQVPERVSAQGTEIETEEKAVAIKAGQELSKSHRAKKKVPLKKVPLKKAPLKKAPLKKAPLKKAPLKKVPLKKVPLKKVPLTKTSQKKPSQKKG